MRRLPDPEFFVPERTKRKRREEAVHDAVRAARHQIVVTHRNCLDGVGSYLIHALAAETPPPVVYTYPSDVHEVIAWIAQHQGVGRTLSINDLSFDRDALEPLVAALEHAKDGGWRIVWRDHHHTQWEGVDTERLTVHVDEFALDREAKECGTSLAQRDLLPEDPLAQELADIIRDRDLWHNQDPRSEQYEFALRHLGTERFVSGFLATRDVAAPWIKAAAEEARTNTDEEVEKAVLSAELFGDRHEVGLIYGEVPKNVTLHELRKRRGTRLEIGLKPDGRFSVRSAKGTDIAHLLAQAYGGGGHPNAAGGKARVPAWEWPAFWLSGGRSPAGMSIVRTALRLIDEHDRTDRQKETRQEPARNRPETAGPNGAGTTDGDKRGEAVGEGPAAEQHTASA